LPTTTKVCKVGIVLETLDGEYLASLERLLEERPTTHGGETDDQLCDRLYEAGFDVAPNTIGRHRSKKCVCYRRR
jgi:hypothetical protein